ncbi:hypothetical protein [Usitatibacter palustris]|uniref:Uncharacterized protein n=1 Tax=Usitatibacter palustris TaxID=2732487 RepID=A0A6M4HDG7_9PROT|nr:hypothetical protein [Usitatibacter palustris]QJR16037.1 hypothetical protein DSM104440_02865 [Usitatibacter palustris]
MAAKETWTRDGVKRRLLARFYTRFHMSLILASSAMAAMVTNWALLQIGVGSMLARYPVAIAMAYVTFLGCVGLWLRYVGLGGKDRQEDGSHLLDGADVPNIRIGGSSGGGGGGGGLGGRGGSFDGGGASTAWTEGSANARMPMVAVADGKGGSDLGKGLGDIAGGGDGDFALLLLAIALILAILAASGYLIFMAPDILTEAAFGALLAGTLAKRSRREDAGGWVSGVVKKTWWPFALVLLVAMILAGYCAAHYPQAKTIRQAFDAATSKIEP